MDREERADAVAGAVGVIHPTLPQGIARNCIELAANGARRKHRHGERNVAFEHAGKAVLVFFCRLTRPDPDCAGDIGGAIEILPARIDQIDRVRGDRDVGRFIHPVMRAGSMRPGGGDGIKAEIAQQRAFIAERAKFCRSAEFGLAALGGFDAQPMEELGDRCSVAGLGVALSSLLNRVLLGLGQHSRIRQVDHLCACSLEHAEHRLHRTFGIDRDLLAGQRLQLRHEGFARAHGDGIAQMGAQFGRDLIFGDEQLGGTIGVGEDE